MVRSAPIAAMPIRTALRKVEGTKKSHRPGLYYCNECKGQFTVTVGTVFERSKIPLTKWWLATHLLGAARKALARTNCTACWASPTRLHGSWPIAFVKPCAT